MGSLKPESRWKEAARCKPRPDFYRAFPHSSFSHSASISTGYWSQDRCKVTLLCSKYFHVCGFSLGGVGGNKKLQAYLLGLLQQRSYCTSGKDHLFIVQSRSFQWLSDSSTQLYAGMEQRGVALLLASSETTWLCAGESRYCILLWAWRWGWNCAYFLFSFQCARNIWTISWAFKCFWFLMKVGFFTLRLPL